MLRQEAIADKASEITAIPKLPERLTSNDGLEDALLSTATNSSIAKSIKNAGANYLLGVQANQPTLQAEITSASSAAPTNRRVVPRLPQSNLQRPAMLNWIRSP